MRRRKNRTRNKVSMKGKNIILGVTGSIAAFKAAGIVTRLLGEGAEVTVVMTDAAQRFVTPLTLETLSRKAVITDLFARTNQPLHVSLAESADLLLVAPATANFMGKFAGGICDDILTCTAIAVRCPILIAPAMNDRLWDHPTVQENAAKLKKIGSVFVGPVEGRLASGRIAVGRLAPVDDIIEAIRAQLVCGAKDQ